MIIAVFCGILTFISLLALVIKVNSDKLNFYNIKILKSEKEVQVLLEKKLSLLSDLQQVFTEQNGDKEFNLLCDIEEIKDDEFMLNSILNKAYRELKNYLEEKRNYVPDDDTTELLNKLYDVDIECTAIKNYYNKNTTILNNKIKSFPNNIISKFKKIFKRELYNDPIEEEFEILKKK